MIHVADSTTSEIKRNPLTTQDNAPLKAYGRGSRVMVVLCCCLSYFISKVLTGGLETEEVEVPQQVVVEGETLQVEFGQRQAT